MREKEERKDLHAHVFWRSFPVFKLFNLCRSTSTSTVRDARTIMVHGTCRRYVYKYLYDVHVHAHGTHLYRVHSTMYLVLYIVRGTR